VHEGDGVFKLQLTGLYKAGTYSVRVLYDGQELPVWTGSADHAVGLTVTAASTVSWYFSYMTGARARGGGGVSYRSGPEMV
jgi:hypothetical protein